VRVTGISTDTLTISRARESPSASNKNAAAKTYSLVLGITAKLIADLAAQTGNGVLRGQVLRGQDTHSAISAPK
jgi:hypothetical protein